jgi:hypothetical protein
MAEHFYLATRFSSLEEAGAAYTPIQEMLRANQAADLSVFRFELSGVAHVAVVGTEPEAPVLAAILEALSSGYPATLKEAAVQWLLERRTQQAQPDTFREGHYTRETGPRPGQASPRSRRRKVPTLQVTWQDDFPSREDAAGTITDMRTGEVLSFPSRFSGVCDWCTAELAPPVAAIHGFTVELEFPDGFVTGTGGKWATCRMCQDRLRLKPGDSEVSFDAVDRLWRFHGSRYLGQSIHGVRIRTFYHERS